QDNSPVTEFAPGAAPPGVGVPTPGAPNAQQTLADSSAGSAAARSPTAAPGALRVVPPPRTDVPLPAGDVATALSRTPAVVTREQPSESSGGIGALRIGEIVAGVVIVVMGGLTVRIFRARRGVSE